jgi:hypothetical protein
MKMKYLIISSIFVLGTIANALEPLRVDNIKTVGRLTYFQAEGEYSYVLPSGFNTTLECESLGQKTQCLFYLYNNINDDEQKHISLIGPAIALSPLHNVVSKVEENIKSSSIDTNFDKIKLLNTMVVSPAPYAMMRFVVTKERGLELQNLYKTTGLGKFNQKVTLRVTDTDFFLGIKDGHEFKNKLLDLDGKNIRSWNLRSTIQDIIKDLAIVSKGYSETERTTLIVEKVMAVYFKKTGFATYQIKTDIVRNIDDSVIFIDDTQGGLPYQCEVSLEIKENAKPITKCNEIE